MKNNRAMQKKRTQNNKKKVDKLYSMGYSYQAIGDKLGFTRQYAWLLNHSVLK